ncbi:MAG: elongation factor P [Candidatus Omnitrophica bacterium]|nr:elongation factor P [Candidatus Omnitrophota bacterium]MDD5672268.1 elongation factor P [Candidatus Omnitrophota bacterium]
MQATDLRKGTTIVFRNDLWVITEFAHRTPGNLRAFVQVTMKNLKNGKLVQERFASTDTVDRAIFDPHPCQYLYHDAEGYHFMQMEDYQSFSMSEQALGDMKYYLKENMEIKIDFFEGRPLMPEIPKVVILKVTESPPWVKGDSVSNNLKPAVCETGLKVMVPIFIDAGTDIKINTETGEYTGRA